MEIAGDATDATIASKLGKRVSTISYDDLDANGLMLVRIALVDTLGVAIAGADFEGARIIVESAVREEPQGSLVIGTNRRASALDAGLVNGIAAHALDYDDGNSIMGGHPSTLLVPAVLALGEERDASARELIAAYAAGYEVMIRLSRGLNTAHYQKGWHPTSTIGVLGVAAAGARLLGLDAERCAVAISIAASMASGIKANFGTMVKALHVGHAVRDGLLCAKLAAGGYSANPAALEAPQGLLNVYNGAGQYDAAAIIADLDGPLEANVGFNAIKMFPCCASTHSAINAGIELHRDGVDPQRIAELTIIVDPNRMPHTDRPHLQAALSGKFSLQYVTARAITGGRVAPEHFTGDMHRDPNILALMARTHVVPAAAGGRPNSFAAEVRATLDDGSMLAMNADRLPPAPGARLDEPERLWEKFAECARPVLGAAKLAAVTDALHAFPDFGSARQLMRLVERDPSRDAVAAEAVPELAA